jgi:hypothetical protein
MEKTEYERHNYAIMFEPINCSHPDCSLDFAEVEYSLSHKSGESFVRDMIKRS